MTAPAPAPKFAAAAGRLTRTTWCVWVAGTLDTASAPRLHGHLAAAARRPDIDLVIIDLADVTFLDASALGTLIQAKQDLHQTGKALRLAGATAEVAQLLQLADLGNELGAELASLPTIHDPEDLMRLTAAPTDLRANAASITRRKGV
jgi:anti-anti-sigma factor